MSFDTVEWHFYLGYLILALMAFRLLYGFVGPRPIRFMSFLPAPSATLHYAKTVPRREPSGSPGHNPLGGLSVILMILVITAVAVTGLFIEADDFFEYGPLNDYVSESMVRRLTGWHDLLGDAILILVILHVAAIFFYLIWKRENLIKAMITGWKWVRDSKHADH